MGGATPPERPPPFPLWGRGGGGERGLLALRNRLQRALLFPLLRLVCRPLHVEGVEHLRDVPGPVLLAANHASHLDTLLLLAALPPARRARVAVAAAADYWYGRPLLGGLVSLLVNAFPMARRGRVRGSLAHCGTLVADGWSLLVYPEGTRSPDGRVQPFKGGVGRLAVALGVPVVPVALSGSYACLPRGAWWPRHGPATVRFGPPLRFAPGTAHGAVTDAVAAAVVVLHSDATLAVSSGVGAFDDAPRLSGGEACNGDTDDCGRVQRWGRPAQTAVQDPAPGALWVQLRQAG